MRLSTTAISICLFVSLLFAACGGARQTTIALDPALVSEINVRGIDERASIVLHMMRRGADSLHYSGYNIRIGIDSTSWIDTRSLELITVGSDEIATVKFVDHLAGAWKGFTRSALTGIAIGSVGALISGDEKSYWYDSMLGNVAFSSALFGGTFGIIGFTFGGLFGEQTRYELPWHMRTDSVTARIDVHR